MIYLDTHVVVWLYAGLTGMFSQAVQGLINRNDIYTSPIIQLELQYLYEINRVNDRPDAIMSDLSNRIGLQIDTEPFENIIKAALTISWTRDPFDRIIVATASLNKHILITKDRTILANYPLSRW